MKSVLITLTAASVLAVAGNAWASEELAKSNGCMNKCHAIDTKKKAPAFKATAKSAMKASSVSPDRWEMIAP